MKPATKFLSAILLAASSGVLGAPEAELLISARTADSVASDLSAVYYSDVSSSVPLLLGNDKGAASGGIRAWALDPESSNGTLSAVAHQTPGRTKALTTVYGVGNRDLVVTVADPDSIVRLFDASTLEVVDDSLKKVLGAWSVVCAWRSPVSGEQYLYLFGKGQGVQFLLRAVDENEFELVEVQTFETAFEASSCAVSPVDGLVFFSGDDDSTVYTFNASESTATPEITILGKASDDITGLTVYVSLETDYLLVAQTDIVEVYDTSLNLLGTLTLSSDDDIEIQGLSIYQAATDAYPAGALAYALESDAGEGFGASSLETAFEALNLTLNTAYDPRVKPCKPVSPITEACNRNGFYQEDGSCLCFAGYAGDTCASFTCREDCSGQGSCIGANTCDCTTGWGGLYCAFKLVAAAEETDAFGGDGDDPAVWIHPTDKSQSKIITTIKSEEGAGLAVFHLNGTTAQTISAGEPDNVDVIYGFEAGSRTVDLAYAACRDDNTLCLFEITSNGTLIDIAGGSQPTKDDYDVYGSCAYRSRLTGQQYLFVNAKTAEYLQYELTWSTESAELQTVLVRNFTGGSGGQVEGCVTDEANGWLLVGEEPFGLWRYSAEPQADFETVDEGYLIDHVGSDGHMWADVEGVTLVEGSSATEGFILVSQQGVSAYNVYRRAAPHDYVLTFTVAANEDKGIDAVSNTDGITAVGASLGDGFPYGIFVTHDDANELAEGGTSEQASFKIVSLADILSEELLAEVDPNWDPRSS
ncbi:hypothetical protein PFICI_10989 [Pestalotiopsis fici W106-1]|uniref:3-phytase n=1 Tax=Pestalotiopsis fici (strain W106-1 / CGMCC3.15140) TaxID=1229662 RepID=W3WTE0_PESFW|nr:uncharacterized protein PFICI_10989 [Pestalotiopsis fici W106-1]ETS77115.1 hypothetical protein PFICI_10989 [Pestalotiopsis fici W106-1]